MAAAQTPGAAPADAAAAQGAAAPAVRGGAVVTNNARPSARSAPRGAKQVAGGDKKVAGVSQLLIFDGQLTMQLESGEFAEGVDAVADIAVDLGGYIAKQDDRSITVRVPSDRFREAMRAMEEVGEVTHRGVQAQDVSEEYHDLGVRLKSLLATRKRLEKFLERAKTIEEVLRVEQELARLNGEIDRIQGRMRFLAARAAFSTITVTLQPRPKPPVKVVVKPTKKPKKVAPPPPPPPRTISLPIDWITSVGLDGLLELR